MTTVEESFLEALEKAYGNGDGFDVKILVGDQTFNASKFFLSAQSPVFRAILQNDTKEKNTNTIEINSFDVNLVGEFLRYLHTGKLDKLKENAMEMFKIADYYGVCGLRTVCLDILSVQLNSVNAVECFKFSSNFNLTDLRDKSLNMLKSGINEDNLINCYRTSQEHACLDLEMSVVRLLETKGLGGFDEWKEMDEEARLKLLEMVVQKCKDNEQNGDARRNTESGQNVNMQALPFHPGYCDSYDMYYTTNKTTSS